MVEGVGVGRRLDKLVCAARKGRSVGICDGSGDGELKGTRLERGARGSKCIIVGDGEGILFGIVGDGEGL